MGATVVEFFGVVLLLLLLSLLSVPGLRVCI